MLTDFGSSQTIKSSEANKVQPSIKLKQNNFTMDVKKKVSKRKREAKTHKAQLSNLQEKDPEFYRFLQQQGQEGEDLLNFDPDELSSDADSDDDEEGGVHQAPDQLEAVTDSEESEEEETDEEQPAPKKARRMEDEKQTKVTIKMVNNWSRSLQENASPAVLHELITAFKAAVVQAAGPEETAAVKYRVHGSTVFNAIVRVCLVQVPPALEQILQVGKPKAGKKPLLPSTSQRWKKTRMDIKSYIGDVMQLMTNVADPAIVSVVLKHVHIMVQYYACFPKLVRVLMKKLITTWSTGEETVRVLAFLSINKILRMLQDQLLEFAIKKMYVAYVRNCKFTSPTTLPLINFMQRSLVEVLRLDVTLTYQYAFIYIRQLAIHLRNAITVKKQDTTQAVYNWQYVHSLHLWARLISQLHPNDTLQPLIYPLIQVVVGTIKLVPTAKYFPLRFHCCRILNLVSEATGVYVPVLPYLTEILDLTDFNKKHKNISFKPLNFTCILKLSKAQLHEKSFRDGVIDQLHEQLLEAFHIHAHSVAFPELTLPTLLQLKKFVRQCKVSNYTKPMRQLIEKVEETGKVITQRRRTATLDLQKPDTVSAWERRSRDEGTPLGRYYATWRKMRTREQQQEISGKERISIDNLPKLAKPTGPRKEPQKVKEFKGLLETDSEISSDEDDDTERFKLKEERVNKRKKTDDESDYSDFDEADLERLAQSASEDDEDDEEEGDDDEGADSDSDDDELPADDFDDDDDDNDQKDIVQDFKFSDDEEED